MANTVALKSLPATADVYRSAVLGMLPGIGKGGSVRPDATLPDTVYTVSALKTDAEKVRQYCAATGQQFGEHLPLTYPFVAQFPLMMQTMVAPAFPFGAVGSVHLENRIRRVRRIALGEPLSIATHAENLREHRKGMLVDIVSRISVGSELVTEQTSTLLKQQRTSLSGGPKSTPPKDHRPPAPDVTLAVDLGRIRSYAAASGDRNPIHMANLTAKAFGFPRAIAHGMWTAAAVLANVEAYLPDEVTYEAKFGKPILLPAKVNGYVDTTEGGWDVSVLNRSKGYPHLTGTLRG
ncbi:MaoC/PaaZ C-terminal domain-containing protein [Williamsia herbipolensis]|uniref:MaoC/PaaZ C-terminal domain-containing protein n=1 Tax=Williamsia herbipolensis TaxID=1603258 RepID=A0AAU4JWU0_9NOCA|nr:MaoC/PaaZ C-terminal domain-containing protein [Williamsia herbipolensis]